MIKLAIFDLDGTLLDTIRDIADACNHALEMCGCPARKLEEYNRLVGRGISNLFRGALPEGRKTEADVELMRSHFKPYYNSHICDSTVPYDGIYEMLDAMKEAGIYIAVASNKYQEGTEKLVRHFFGRYDFVCISGQREGKAIKPAPDMIFEIMEKCGADAAETIYCGDSDVDMQTGINAGVRTIGAAWGFRGREELETYKPWFVADSPRGISGMIAGDSE